MHKFEVNCISCETPQLEITTWDDSEEEWLLLLNRSDSESSEELRQQLEKVIEDWNIEEKNKYVWK